MSKKIGFETNPRKGHEFWNNEADAFKHEKEIDAQVQAMGGKMPLNSDMEGVVNSGGAIYVHSYTRSDGTQVKGYYRSK